MGFETSEGFISDITDKIFPQTEDWQNRPLDQVYPVLYIDAIHYSVCDNSVIRKLAAFEAAKKWTATIRNWAQVYGELSIMYEGRLPE